MPNAAPIEGHHRDAKAPIALLVQKRLRTDFDVIEVSTAVVVLPRSPILCSGRPGHDALGCSPGTKKQEIPASPRRIAGARPNDEQARHRCRW